ncbi:MAG: imidazole glycerol phosphate synthase subunit HisH [Chthoniobacter sp.]|nr:imidazole glycerol phosphate synthase subunit HisH [Chthoniobacter sp.]
MKLRAAIIEYRMGNIASLSQALLRAGVKPHLARTTKDIDRADFLVLPGVGEFSMAVDTMHANGLFDHLRDTIAREEKLVLGICLGMQLFAESSEESPGVKGLAVLEGAVKRLPFEGGPVPHTGWTQVAATNGSGIDGCYYFSHSFYFDSPEDQVIALTSGNRSFPACVRWRNIVGCQFHPEKSQASGETFLAWFLKIVRDHKKFG